MDEPRAIKQDQAELCARLRAEGQSWVQIAAVLRERYRVNARVAFRLARGWSQQRVATEWNARWPDERKTHKSISYWEIWPSSTGYEPSIATLERLAQLYECSVSDLLIDLPNYGHLDTAHKAAGSGGALTGPPASDARQPVHADNLFMELLESATSSIVTDMSRQGALSLRLQEADLSELASVIVMWTQGKEFSNSRRDLLGKMGAAFSLAAAAPLFNVGDLDGDERQRISRASASPSRVDAPTLRHCEETVATLRRQGDVLGPQLTLQSVMAYRHLVEPWIENAAPELRSKALAVHAEFTQLLGWLCFNLGDYRTAQHYYEDARATAHQAEDVELVTYILCAMSHLATWRGHPRVGIDHAVAAATWAKQSDSVHAVAYAADVAVRAHLAARNPAGCGPLLDQEYQAICSKKARNPAKSWWYFYDESFYWSTATLHAIGQRAPGAALKAVSKSMELVDPSNLHERAFRMLHRAEAHVLESDAPAACNAIGEVVLLPVSQASGRLRQRVVDLRGSMTKWDKTKSVRQLDEQLAVYLGSGESGSTNSTYSRK